MEDKGLATWASHYAATLGYYDGFRLALEGLLRELLKAEKLEYAQIESRTKSPESLIEKVARKGEKYNDPLREVTDLTGLRVIVYFTKDVETVGSLIDQQFAIDWDNSVRQGADSDPDRFGYRSDHYVIRIGDRARYPEWAKFASNCAEIQVRTVMQHAWAAVDHKIRYKSSDLPRNLQRRLFRLSALLEVADEQFASLQQERGLVTETYQHSMAQGNYDVSLDMLSLVTYLNETQTADHWSKLAIKAGFVEHEAQHGTAYAFGDQTRRLERLLRVLQNVGIQELQELQELLDAFERGELPALEVVVQSSKTTASGPPDSIYAFPEDVLTIVVLISSGNARLIAASGFRKDIKSGIRAAMRRASKDGI
jgi:putative GTP pyrophosphokinase